MDNDKAAARSERVFQRRVGARVKEFRTGSRLSLYQLAEAAGTSPAYMRAIEAGQAQLTAYRLGAIAVTLHISAGSIIGTEA